MADFLSLPKGERLKRSLEQRNNFIEATNRANEIMKKVKSKSVKEDYETKQSASLCVLDS
jgi:hypothetical protein